MKAFLFLCGLVAVASATKMMRALTGERQGTCPASSGMAGICLFDPNVNCLRDAECSSGQKCCSEGCGRVCKNIASRDSVHAGACPTPTSLVGICMLMPNSCSGDGDCAEHEKCCHEGCNRVCKTALDSSVLG